MRKTTMISSLIAATFLLVGSAQAAPKRQANQRRTPAVRSSARKLVQAPAKRAQHKRATGVRAKAAVRKPVVRVKTTVRKPVVRVRTTVRKPVVRVRTTVRKPVTTVYPAPYVRRTTVAYPRVARPMRARRPVVTTTAYRRPAPRLAYLAFQRIDRNRDGYISRREARQAGYTVRNFRRADQNRDGLLTRYEARAWL